ncbi:hypothetical protein GLYMA_12G011300v4 [Glycine max]|uniref:Uncharacterized protein n=2 Tax=Glycine subgen. Soja TaxID=1462606 RepID=K7LSD9_SOYBN|nr:hypothetical protein GYH30_032348 [Glycine max]KRH23925.1 hypothetical protein GLYMA_12G011300v4 [Glycine max]RZB73688.1 hypothetical protein D0Y65_033032 [Glycine soja]
MSNCNNWQYQETKGGIRCKRYLANCTSFTTIKTMTDIHKTHKTTCALFLNSFNFQASNKSSEPMHCGLMYVERLCFTI